MPRKKEDRVDRAVKLAIGLVLIIVGFLALRFGWFTPVGRALVHVGFSAKPPAAVTPEK